MGLEPKSRNKVLNSLNAGSNRTAIEDTKERQIQLSKNDISSTFTKLQHL